MLDCIERLRKGLLATVDSPGVGRCPPRSGFVIKEEAGSGIIENMPYFDDERGMTLKTISYKPRNNTAHRLPTVIGTICRYNSSNGELTAICDATIPTAIRTGAATALASSFLARPDAHIVGVIGAGLQSVTQIHGLSTQFDLDHIRAYDVDAERSRSLQHRCPFTSAAFDLASTPSEAVSGADIVVTATSVSPGTGPVFPDEHLAEHLHINSIGADEPGKTELPRSVMERSYVCVDHIDQALKEGECQILQRKDIDATLQDLVVAASTDPKPSAQTNVLSVFDSTGFAFEDHLALDVFLDYAADTGIGDKIPILDGPIGLHSPYSLPA
nr:ornithine cyclodeaminase family protein [Mycolicibacterium baixiangningiae]